MGLIQKDGLVKNYSLDQLKTCANEMRGYCLISLFCSGSGHSGGSLSIMDVLSVLYLNQMNHKPHEPNWDERDRLFFSAGHKAPAWYTALGYCGYFDILKTATLRKLLSPFQGHPDRKKCAGVEMSCGSLGQGLSVAVGDALRAKLDKKDYYVYCIMGDGEQQEGQIWEASMEASHHKLNNLIAIVDKNELQIDGNTKDVMNIDPIEDKYKSFGWNVIQCNGHDVQALISAFENAKKSNDKPSVIIANTIKGKGVSFIENKAGWHGKVPNEAELDTALSELNMTHLPKDKMIKIAKEHQKKIDEQIDDSMPKFSKNYWWNVQEEMKVQMRPTRMGFGDAICESKNENIVALGADITGSICMNMFYEKDPKKKERFFSMGIAEQSGTCVAAGLAKEGKIPLFGTYGVFAAGRALDQVRTTVAYGDLNVKIIGAHGGISVGPDGATHQALEEIFQIHGLPNMNLLVPCDSIETKKASDAMIEQVVGPCYIRYAREATPIVTDENTPYKFGIATVIRYRSKKQNFKDAFETLLSTDAKNENEDITIISCGPETAEAMRAIWILREEYNINARVLNLSTLKPLDKCAIIACAKDTGAILTAEEHQKGGLGNLISSTILCSDELYAKPILFDMIGVNDKFGESGAPWELMKSFGLCAEHIARKAYEMVSKKRALSV